MKPFDYDDHVAYVKLALPLLDIEKPDMQSLTTMLEFGELIKKHSSDNNALIFDATEYIYEQIRLLNGEDGAFNDTELRTELDKIASL